MSRRKWSRVVLSVGKIAIWMVVGGIALRPILQVSPLQHAVNVIQHSRNGVLPADFNESVAIVRAAHKPLEHLNLGGATVECLDLSGLNMLRASGQFMHATGASFDDSILGGAMFGNSELNGAKFRHAHMDAISFEHSNMLVANMVGAEARDAHFAGASLTGANLSYGAFSGTDFSGADLRSRVHRFYARYGKEVEQIAELLQIRLKQLALAYTLNNKLPAEAVRVSARVKTIEPFLKKLENDNWPTFYYPTEVVRDLIGARVVCWFRPRVRRTRTTYLRFHWDRGRSQMGGTDAESSCSIPETLPIARLPASIVA